MYFKGNSQLSEEKFRTTSSELDHDDFSKYFSTAALECPLYKGTKMTVSQALVKHFEWFTSHPGTSKEALSELLHMERSILPNDNLLPDSYYSALRLIEPFLLKPVVYHACPNDCIVFHNEHADCVTCPKCGSSRYKRKNLPAKKFLYLPLGPKITRMFSTKYVAQIIQSHPGEEENSCSSMYDIYDSPVWKKAYSKDGIFEGDRRGLSFALCTDGVNPFSHNRITYSMWPIMLTLLNLPRKIRNLFNNIFLMGIIPGNGTQEPKSLDPYIDIIVEELLKLSGTQMYDAYQGTKFNLKAEILMYVLDYPALGKLFKISGSGAYKGCAWCDITGIHIVYLSLENL